MKSNGAIRQTKTAVLENHWMEFIEFLQQFYDKTSRPYDPIEQDFWEWYLDQ
jgi:hypothetical protein